MATWIKFQNNENATEIFDIDRATHFRHVAANDESFIEVHADGAIHSIMHLTDPQAYEAVMNFVAATTGYSLGSK